MVVPPISHPKCWSFLVGKPHGCWGNPPSLGNPHVEMRHVVEFFGLFMHDFACLCLDEGKEQFHVMYSNPEDYPNLRASPKTIRPHHCGTYQVVWGLNGKKSSKSPRKTRMHVASPSASEKTRQNLLEKTVFCWVSSKHLCYPPEINRTSITTQLYWAAKASSAKSRDVRQVAAYPMHTKYPEKERRLGLGVRFANGVSEICGGRVQGVSLTM